MTHSVHPGVGLVAVLCLALGACNGAAGPSAASLEESAPASGADMQALAPRGAVPGEAVVSLPQDAGAVMSVRNHTYVDGLRQDVLLKGSPVRGVENGITMLAQTSRTSTLDEKVPLFKPTEAAIRAELGRAFPHLAMQVVERPSANGFGPYGLALGRAGGTIHCVYMWQWIDAVRVGRDADLAGPASVRVRLCRPDTTFDALAAMMDHLSLDPDAGSRSVAVVDPPSDPPEPRTRAAPHRARHARRLAVARVDDRPAAGASLAAPAAPVALAGDLPPQAYLGPTKSAPTMPATPVR